MNYYGVEIELERASRCADYPLPDWNMMGDGSLRNGGLEFVFNGPIPYGDVPYMLDTLHRHIAELSPDADANERCSTHIHMDVRDLSTEQMVQVLLNYELIEPMLFHSMAAEREDNHFCVPHYMTKDRNSAAANYLKQFNLNALYRDTHKYSAFNLRTIRDLTTMEWRHFPAVLPVTTVKQWVDMIEAFKNSTRDNGIWDQHMAQDFCSQWFGGYDEELIDTGMETMLYTQDGLEQGPSRLRNPTTRYVQRLKDEIMAARLRERPTPDDALAEELNVDEEEWEEVEEELEQPILRHTRAPDPRPWITAEQLNDAQRRVHQRIEERHTAAAEQAHLIEDLFGNNSNTF